MRHLRSRPGHRHPLYVTDPDTGRTYVVPQGGDENDGGGEGGGEGQEGQEGQGSEGGQGNEGQGSEEGSGDDGKTLTQAEVDAIVAKRLSDAKAKWQQEAAQAAERAKMDEAERLKAEKEDAEKAAQAATEAANARIVRSEAKVLAVAEGGDPKQADNIVRLAALDGIEVDDDGNPDVAAIKKAVAKVLSDIPALKAAAGAGRSGGELGGGQSPAKATNIEDAVNAKYAGQGQ